MTLADISHSTGIRSSSALSAELEAFLTSVLDHTRPDWIITLERKGTALLRTYAENTSGPSQHWPGWERVRSQHALHDVSPNELSGRVLVLDDAMHFGRQIETLLTELEQLGIHRSDVRIAAFAVHRDCDRLRPDFWWYRDLSDHEFRTIRTDLIKLFQYRGSLLLDTEHVELKIRTTCSVLDLFTAFANIGASVYHTSCGGRTNLTIYRPIILDKAQFTNSFPRESIIDDVVHKIRVVERGNGEFSIIPIFYPAIPRHSEVALRDALPDALTNLIGSDDRNFHLVGVLAALRLFRTAIAALRDLIWENRVAIELDETALRESLLHLLALFPRLDVDAIESFIRVEIESGLSHPLKASEQVSRKQRILINASEGTPDYELMDQFHWIILQGIMSESKRLSAPQSGVPMTALRSRLESYLRQAPTLREEALFSAAFDRAIDDGDIGTDEAVIPFEDGIERETRVFLIDNEVVFEDVNRSICLSGATPPWRSGFATRP